MERIVEKQQTAKQKEVYNDYISLMIMTRKEANKLADINPNANRFKGHAYSK